MKLFSVKNMALFFLVASSIVYSQAKTKSELRASKKATQEKKTFALIASGSFEFIANRALPTGYGSIDLTPIPNFISFSAEFIKSDMPYFGRVTGSLPYGSGDGGLKFEGKPETFSLNKSKKGHKLLAGVSDKNNYYSIQLTIFDNGDASLVITSTNRATISYQGFIAEGNKVTQSEK